MNYKHNQDFITAFGQNLRRLREEKGISLRGLADEAEMENKQLYLIEHGKVNTSISTAYALAKVLGVEPKVLFDFPFLQETNKSESSTK